jgi:hypothetical protein
LYTTEVYKAKYVLTERSFSTSTTSPPHRRADFF